MTRAEILDEAKKIVTVDRNLEYGDPEDNFKDIADLWTAYLGWDVNSVDVAMMMILLKMTRLKQSPHKPDHYVDMAGYAACAAECSNG
jgi:Domain of unknown function (DUF6378)